MGHYQQYQPNSISQPFVDALWINESATEVTSRVLPDGCSDIMIHVTGGESRLLFVGPMTTAGCFTLKPGEYFVGVRFKPGTVLRNTPHVLHALRDKTLPIDYAAAMPRHATSSQNLLDYLEQWVSALAKHDQLIRDPAVDRVLHAIEVNPFSQIKSLYREMRFHSRAVERRFLKMVGMPPKFYARVQRHQLAAHHLAASTHSLSALAQDLGYADQAHFVHDFEALAGITPANFRLENTR